MSASNPTLRRHAQALAWALAVCLLAAPAALAQDDLELLRAEGGKPFLFFIIDTSSSMATDLDGRFVDAGGDDPRSKLYIAKEAIYEVFGTDGDEFSYGFAGFNQDQLHVVSKHYLYYFPSALTITGSSSPWPINTPNPGSTTWPRVMTSGVPLTTTSTPTGDFFTFGKSFPFSAGTCASPLAIDAANLAKLNRYSKAGLSGNDTTTMWTTSGSGSNVKIYRISVRKTSGTLGDGTIDVEIVVDELVSSDCASPPAVGSGTKSWTATGTARLERPFLLTDGTTQGETPISEPGGGSFGNNGERGAGPWDEDEIDGFAFHDVDGAWYCGDAKPFSGTGWEGNYDSGPIESVNDPDGVQPSPDADDEEKVDTHCADDSQYNPNLGIGSHNTCYNLKRPTNKNIIAGLDARELDVGDMIPLDWTRSNLEEFLERLNPNHVDGVTPSTLDFGQAAYFQDSLHPVTQVLQLLDPAKKPLIAAGPSPLNSAMLDFRCYYSAEGENKCGKQEIDHFPTGWQAIQEANDPSWRCRRPYMVFISDGEVNCGDTQNYRAVIASFFSQVNVGSWALTMSDDPIFTNFNEQCCGGEEVLIDTKDELVTALENIRGQIQEETKSFASAAVPSVQADVADKVYLTTFEPVSDLQYWRGHVRAFLKPVPLVDDQVIVDGLPVSVRKADETQALWDVAKVLRTQVPDANLLDYTLSPNPTIPIPTDQATLGLGDLANQRRVVYAMDAVDDTVPWASRLFAPPGSYSAADNEAREDLWAGITGGTYDLTGATQATIEADATLKAARDTVHKTLVSTLYKKKATLDVRPEDDLTNDEFILGDVFHANPEVVGPPANAFYLSNAAEFPGYRDFALKHLRRRNMLFFAANDGQLHGIDAGVWTQDLDTTQSGDQSGYGDGTGLELFSYVPRAVMPKLRKLAAGGDHEWTVDGNFKIFDANVDVAHDGTPDATEREWRTVLVGSLRRGGAMIYALDVTQPDPLDAVTTTASIAGTPTTVLSDIRPTTENALAGCVGATLTGSPGSATTFTLADGSTMALETGCDTEAAWPAVRWEFTDDERTEQLDAGGNLITPIAGADGETDDEDLDGAADLGETWSTPNLGAIRLAQTTAGNAFVVDANGIRATEARYVAVFGGGRDPEGRFESVPEPMVPEEVSGDWIYVVDVETGKVLYKANVAGSVAAEPAAVDTDQDGFIDRIYVATTSGIIYRIDTGNPPRLSPTTGRILPEDNNWEPYPIFDTIDASTGVRKPIFFRPSVAFVPELNEYALAFGTGRRDAMWSTIPSGGNRIVVFVDDVDERRATSATPLGLYALEDPPATAMDETDLVEIGIGDASLGNDVDLLSQPPAGERGWYIRLLGESSDFNIELVATPVNTVSGLTAWSTFLPRVEGPTSGDDEGSCRARGKTRNYLTFTDNGDAIFSLVDAADPDTGDVAPRRFETLVGTFVSEPFFEPRLTQNAPPDATDPDDPSGGGLTDDDLCATKDAVAEAIKDRIFPSTCRFGNFRFDLKLMRTDTGLECLASIPVCLIEKNWREF